MTGLEILFLLGASYVLVAPDKHTLKVRSGLAGAIRGMVGSRRAGGSGSASTSSSRRRGGRGKRPAAGGTNLFTAARDGWREGVRAAEKRRAAGKDTWSRTVRAGRRIGQGAGRLVGGTRSVIAGARAWRQERADRRATVADFEAAEGEHLADVITIDPADTGRRPRAADRARFAAGGDAAPGGDTGVVFLVDRANGQRPASLDGRTYGGADCPCAMCQGGHTDLCRWRDSPELQSNDERAADGQSASPDHGVLITEDGVIITSAEDDAPANACVRHYPVSVDSRRLCGICGTTDLDQVSPGLLAGDLNHTKENDMSVNMTELDSLDSLKSETDQAKAATAPVVEAVTGVQEWAKSLPERAAANGWGTKGLDEAFAALAELVPQGDWGPFLDGLTRIEHEINQARALGEIAAAQGARGSVDAFKSA